MNRIPRTAVAGVALAWMAAVSTLQAADPPAAETATPAPESAPKPPTDAELQSQFAQADKVRAATAEKTKERARSAKSAMQLATDIAWRSFDAGKYEEAATWFARS